MNKVYRVIYNKSINQTMVVSEITKSHTKSGSSLTDKRSGNVSGCLKSMDFKKSAMIVAMVSLFTPLSVFAATPDGVATPAGLVTTGNPSVQLGSESGVTSNATNHPSVANGGNEVKDKTSSVWGTKNSSNGSYSTVWGQGNTATGTNATAFGSGSTASGTNSTAYGLGSTASGSNTTAWGSGYAGAVQSTDTVNYTISSDNYPVDENGNRPTFTITKTVTENGENATAWGGGRAIGSNATAMAKGKAYGRSSLAVGNGAIAYGPNSIAFGRGKAIGSDSIAFGQSTAFGPNSFANGSSKTIARGSNSVAYGESTIAEGNNAMTWGFGTRTTGHNATAFGKWTVASGERATAFGMQTKALGENSVAAGGLDNVVNANNAAALGGQNAVVSGLNSVTLGGNGSQALANNSLAAVGGVVSAGASNAVALGGNATLQDSVALGSGSTTAAGVPVESAGKIGDATYTNHTWSNKLADANKVVSVGNRQIQYVANGQVSASSTDAINGSQLYAAYQDLQWKASVSRPIDGGIVSGSGAVAEQVIGDYQDSKNKGVVNFKAGKGIEIETANKTSLDMTFKVHKEEDGHTETDGKIDGGTADQYWDSVQVANAINASGWKLGNSIINPGDSVSFTGENGINVTAKDSNVKISFTDTHSWVASDGSNKTTVNKDKEVVWRGSGSLKVENENGTFTISDNTTYESKVNGLGLAKDGDVVKLTGNVGELVDGLEPLKFAGDSGDTLQPKFGDTVKIVGDGQNISVLGKDGQLNVGLNKDVVLGDDSDSGSLKVGDTLINNDGMTINNGSQGKPVTLTKNGLDNGGNRITHVADGVEPDDAVNVSQLKEAVQNQTTQVNANINKIIYGEDNPTDERKKELLKTYNANSEGVRTTNSVAEAVHNMNEYGIKFFHTNDGTANPQADSTNTDDSIAGGQYATAIGWQARANGENALAIGNGATATKANSIAIGAGNTVTGDKSIAIGYGHTVSGSRSGAFGDPSKIDGDDSYAVGNNVEIAKGNNKVFVLGNNVKETHSNSVFLGDSSAYTAAGASTAGMDAYATNAEDIKDVNGNVAIEKGSLKFAGAKPAGVVSVGTVGEERRIQNVAAGLVTADSTDAINGSQLYSVAQQVSKVSNGGAGPVQYSNANSPTIPNGGIRSNDVTLVGADSMQPVTIHNVASGRNPNDAVNVSQLQQATSNLGNRLNDRIDSVSQRSDASAASSIAVASMPQAYIPGKSLISAGGGTYHGQTGYAIGISTISDSGNWILKGTATGNSQKRYGAGVGVGYQW